ncbi:MAG: translation initiation factor IF-5A [Nanoarchaeota archaeon]|nr:translation initiation factor IF-5A [Nanoarchaeota archaeon]
MVARVIDAKEMRIGTFLLINGMAWQVKKMDVSKTGKHGHAKIRFEAVSIITGKKKVAVVPGDDKFEVPMIEKKEAQILSISNGNAGLMDSESFENFELPIPEELISEATEGKKIEYWIVEGDKMIRRVM